MTFLLIHRQRLKNKLRLDSIRMQELELQLQEMKLNEIVLRSELSDALNKHITTDSLKKEEQRRSIDSLRTLTPRCSSDHRQ